MALTDLLYRCPRCGHGPTEGTGDAASCPACTTGYRRNGPRIVAQGPQEAAEGLPALPDAWQAGVEPHALLAALERLGGPLGAATRPDGTVRHRARALHHGLIRERPVRRGGRLLGFADEAGEGRPGVLEANETALRFRFDDGGADGVWPLDEVTALQLASRALQVGVRGGGTLQWTLLEDSPLRWEGLVQALLRRRWRASGRGEIVEFQPRIVAG